ncbi:MAG: hypothetical protein ACLSVG_08125 [Clostridia bacterium]
MRSKNFMTRCLLGGLAVLSILSFTGCKEGNETLPVDTFIFNKQYDNGRYYCKQGYPDDWTVKADTEEAYYLKQIDEYADGSPMTFTDCGLVAQFSPQNDAQKVKYSIYTLKGTFMRATQGDILIGLLGKNGYKFEFNNLFIDNEEHTPRDAFVWAEDIEDTTESIKKTEASYNKISFQKLAYTFTQDGVDWMGTMLVTVGKEGFYLITLETEKASWDTYYETMETMLNDFRMLGWETEK